MNRSNPQAPQTQIENVLIIDDDPEIRGILQERLRIEGLESITAASGELGLARFLSRIAEGEPYQTLILDIRMKGISGIELLKLIRLIDQQSTILMISGLGDLSKAVLCLRHGADDYLSKPIKIWDLKARLATAQGRRNALNNRPGGAKNKGLQWGTAFVPQVPEEFSSAWSKATSIPGDQHPIDSKNLGSGEGVQGKSESKHSQKNEEEKLKSPDPQLDPGVLETREEKKGLKGRKGGSFQESPRHGSGESRAKAARESGTLGSGPKKKAPREQPNPAPHPGGEADLRATSPLDVFFFLVHQLERQEAGWDGHSQRLSQFLSKAAALYMRELNLELEDLNALLLASLVHNLGLIRAHGTLGHGFATPTHASSKNQRVHHSLLEDLTLPARVLEGLRPLLAPSQQKTAEKAQMILEQAGRFRRQLREYGSILEKPQEEEEEESHREGKRKTEALGLFFQLADLCFHEKSQDPSEDLLRNPKEDPPRSEKTAKKALDPSFPAMKAYAIKLGFPFDHIWEGLSHLLN